MKADLTSRSGQVGEGRAQMWAGGEGMQGKGRGAYYPFVLSLLNVYMNESEEVTPVWHPTPNPDPDTWLQDLAALCPLGYCLIIFQLLRMPTEKVFKQSILHSFLTELSIKTLLLYDNYK